MGRRGQRRARRGHADGQDAKVAFSPQYGQSIAVVSGSDHDLVKDWAHSLRRCGVHGAVEGHYAAESADGIAFISLPVRLGNGVAAGKSAGVVMLHYCHGGFGEVGYGAPSGVGVHQVVV